MELMEPLDLPDGWYQIPGDGLGPGENDRVSYALQCGGGVPRNSYSGWVEGGQLLFIWPSSGIVGIIKETRRDSQVVWQRCIRIWGEHPQELIRRAHCRPAQKIWENDLVLEE